MVCIASGILSDMIEMIHGVDGAGVTGKIKDGKDPHCSI